MCWHGEQTNPTKKNKEGNTLNETEIRDEWLEDSDSNSGDIWATKGGCQWAKSIGKLAIQLASWSTPVGDKIVRYWTYSKHQIPRWFNLHHNPTVCHWNILKQNQQLPARQAVLHGHQMNIAFGDLLPYWQIVQLFNLILRPKWPFWSTKLNKSWRTYSVRIPATNGTSTKNECFASNKSFFPHLSSGVRSYHWINFTITR